MRYLAAKYGIMQHKVTVYIDDDIHQEILKMMANKVRTLSYIANELMAQAVKEKNRKKKFEKRNNPITDNSPDSCESNTGRPDFLSYPT